MTRTLHLHVLQIVCRHCKNSGFMRRPLVLQPQASNDTKFGNVHIITCAGAAVRENALVTLCRMVKYDQEKT
jgi:hypothetical protein